MKTVELIFFLYKLTLQYNIFDNHLKRSTNDNTPSNLLLCSMAAVSFYNGLQGNSRSVNIDTTDLPRDGPIQYFEQSALNDRTELMEAHIYRRHLNTGTRKLMSNNLVFVVIALAIYCRKDLADRVLT